MVTSSSATDLLDIALPFSGLSCAGDAARIERRLQHLDGVESVTVNPVTETAYVRLDATRVTAHEVRQALERLGLHYPLPT